MAGGTCTAVGQGSDGILDNSADPAAILPMARTADHRGGGSVVTLRDGSNHAAFFSDPHFETVEGRRALCFSGTSVGTDDFGPTLQISLLNSCANDASAYSGVSFLVWANRSSGFAVTAMTQDRTNLLEGGTCVGPEVNCGEDPPMRSGLRVGPSWQPVSLNWSDFLDSIGSPMDPAQLMSLSFALDRGTSDVSTCIASLKLVGSPSGQGGSGNSP